MNLKETYTELAELITTNIPAIKWVDLWANQTEMFEVEFPFPFPAVFIEINSDDIESIGELAQDINAFITFHVAYETLAETYQGSYNQNSALGFFDLLTDLHKLLHSTYGANFGQLNRVALRAEQSGDNIIQYGMTYTSVIRDYSAMKQYEQAIAEGGAAVQQGKKPVTIDNTFQIHS